MWRVVADPSAFVKLLWKPEALRLLESIGEAHGLRWRPRREAYLRLLTAIPDPGMLRTVVREALLTRFADLIRDKRDVVVDTGTQPGLGIPGV